MLRRFTPAASSRSTLTRRRKQARRDATAATAHEVPAAHRAASLSARQWAAVLPSEIQSWRASGCHGAGVGEVAAACFHAPAAGGAAVGAAESAARSRGRSVTATTRAAVPRNPRSTTGVDEYLADSPRSRNSAPTPAAPMGMRALPGLPPLTAATCDPTVSTANAASSPSPIRIPYRPLGCAASALCHRGRSTIRSPPTAATQAAVRCGLRTSTARP